MIASMTGWTCNTAGTVCAFHTDRAEAFFTIAGLAGFAVGVVVWNAIFGAAR